MSEEMKDKYIDIRNFNLSKDDLFGRYCHIEMEFYGKEGNQIHIFKIVGQLRSNGYCDVPFNHSTKPAYVHDKIIDIVNVIECGVSEEKVYRVALKDVKILKSSYDTKEKRLKKVEDLLTLYKSVHDAYRYPTWKVDGGDSVIEILNKIAQLEKELEELK